MEPLRWGVIGTGVIAGQFCSDMRYVNNGVLYAVASRDVHRGKMFAKSHGVPVCYADYKQLLLDPDIDVVYIASPHTCHFQQTHDAIMAGKSVLCEKPLTINSAQCLVLQQLAKAQGVFLMEGMWTYFLPALIKAKEWVNSGKIGAIKHIKADFGYPATYEPNERIWNAQLAGGCLLDIGIYPLAFAYLFTGKAIQEVSVNAEFADNGVEKDLVMTARVGSVDLTLSASFQRQLSNQGYIVGDKGTISLKDFWMASECSLHVDDQPKEHFTASRESVGLHYEVSAVGDALGQGLTEHPAMPLSVSYSLQQQMETVRRQF